MKKISALLIITLLLSACSTQPEQTTTESTTIAATTTEATTTTEMTTTAAESTTSVKTTASMEEIPVAPEEAPIGIDSYIGGFYDGIEREVIDRRSLNDNYEIYFTGPNTRAADSETITAEFFELLAVDKTDNTIKHFHFLPFIDAGRYPIELTRQWNCLKRFDSEQNNQLLCLSLPTPKEDDLFFFTLKESGFEFFNGEPFEAGGFISFDREKNTVTDEISRIEYSFDFENMTYSGTELPPVEAQEYAPDYSDYEYIALDFLTEEQNETWVKSFFIKHTDISSDSAGLPYSDEYTLDYYIPTNVSYDSFEAFIKSAFTDEVAEAILSPSPFINVNGLVYWMDGARGGDISYRGCDFELVSKDESSVKFKCIAYHNDGDVYTEYSPDDPDSYSVEHPLEMVKTENGWRMEYYTLWY